MKYGIIVSLFALLVGSNAHAQVNVEDAWARATVPQQRATGAFMKLTSAKAGRIVGVASPAAAIVEIHEMKMEGEVMRMRPVDGLDLPRGETVELKPGGHHVMLVDLKDQVRDGDTIPIALTVEYVDGDRQVVEILATARPLTHRHQGDQGHHRH